MMRKQCRGTRRTSWCTLAICCAGAFVGLAKPAHAGPTIGLGPGIYNDTGEREITVDQGVDTPEPDRIEFENDGLLNLGAWVLFPLSPKIRVGGGIRWFGNYETKDPDAEESNGQDVETYKYGTTFQLYGQGEYVVDFDGPKLLLGAQAGLITIIPGGDFQEDLESDQARGYDTNTLPRPGIFAGPLVGGSFPLAKRLNLRADLGLQFARVWLQSSSAESQAAGLELTIDSHMVFTRLFLGLGIEVDL